MQTLGGQSAGAGSDSSEASCGQLGRLALLFITYATRWVSQRVDVTRLIRCSVRVARNCLAPGQAQEHSHRHYGMTAGGQDGDLWELGFLGATIPATHVLTCEVGRQQFLLPAVVQPAANVLSQC